MFPLRDENRSRTTPYVTRGIIALNVAVFLYELWLGPGLRDFIYDWALVPARLTMAVRYGGESPIAPLSTLLSAMFMHGGWMHLIGNMWYLWIFGDNVEDRLGHLRFLVFYLAMGLVSGLAHFASDPAALSPTLGASGAIAGVLGAYLSEFPRARVLTLVPLFPFFQVLALPALVVLGLWFVFQAFSGAMSLGAAAGTGGIAWWAHIGGFVAGFVTLRLARLFGPRRR